MRVFQELQGAWSELPDFTSIAWTDTLDMAPTCQVSVAWDLWPIPDRLLIVPSDRDIDAPYYGPFDVVNFTLLSPWGVMLEATQGHDFATIFGAGASLPLLANIEAQIMAYANSGFEPFATWTSEPGEDDPDYVAKVGAAFAAVASAAIINAANLQAVEAALAQFGLNAHILVESGFVERLTLWPKHPLVTGGAYGVTPVVGVVTAWLNGLPVAFGAASPLPNALDLPVGDYCGWEDRPLLRIPDLFNAPVGSGQRTTYLTRQLVLGHRLLGTNQDVIYFRTGTRGPALYLPITVGRTGNAKFQEENVRWDMQNSAATWTGRRGIRDEWENVEEVALAPLQIIAVPEDLLPEWWGAISNRFVVRQVSHSWQAEGGYFQQVRATLWQGGFLSLPANLSEVDVTLEFEDE